MKRHALRLAVTSALTVLTMSATISPIAAASPDTTGAGPSFTLQRLERVCSRSGGQFTDVPSVSPGCADARLRGRTVVRAGRTCERLGGTFGITGLDIDRRSVSWTCDFSAI